MSKCISFLKQVNRPLGITPLPPSGGNLFGDAGRRFVEQSPAVTEEQSPVAEDEGLGSRLSLLESALNGQISRSPTRGMAQQQHLIGSGNADLLLSDSAHSISPLVSGMDSQSGGSDVGASGGSNLLNEQLREFESVFMRVASSTTRCRNNSQTNRSSEWDAADLEPESSYMAIEAVGPGEFLAQHSTFSDSMDVSEADPSPGGSEDPLSHSELSAERINSTTLGSTDAPLEQLLNAAAVHRHALVRDEKDTGMPSASLSSVVVKQEPMDESSSSPPEASDDQDQQLHHLLPVDENQLDLPPPTTLTAGHSFHSLKLTAATTSTTNTIIAVKTEPHSSSKCVTVNRNKTSAKCSQVVSPGPSGSNTPNKNTVQGITPTAPATSSAPSTPLSAAAAAAAAAAKTPQKAHDDEGTVSRVHAILEMYKEQLRNSPDLQNKPAPRRRSNPLPSPTTTPKRRKSVQNKTKLMSQQMLSTGGTPITDGASVSGADLTLTTSSSAESTTSVLGEQLATTSVLPDSITTLLPAIDVIAVDVEPVVKTEPVTTVSSVSSIASSIAVTSVTSAPSTPTTSATTITLSTVEKTEDSPASAPAPEPAPSPAPACAPPTTIAPPPAPTSVQVLSAPTGIQLTTIPVSTVVTSRPACDLPGTFLCL